MINIGHVVCVIVVLHINSCASNDDCVGTPDTTSPPVVDENGCTVNETYVPCLNDCPETRCPASDGPEPVCDLIANCCPGCQCKINYRKSVNGNCIRAIDCPPLNCTTRPNEMYMSCPEPCRDERCEARNNPPVVCNTLLLNCQPKCVCAPNHWRKDGICVKRSECCD